jgi:hypothetical protein
MPTITADAALAVVPFFAPLTIIFCGLLFALARSQTDIVRRVDLLEQKASVWRSAKAVRFKSPLAVTTSGMPKDSGQP